MNLYNCKSVSDGYRVTKFTKDFVVESSYVVSSEGCDCPAGIRPVCRHRTMLPFFEKSSHIDDGWFFIWDTRQWLAPVGEAAEVAEQNQHWKDPDLIRPQGAPLSNDDQGAPSSSETDLLPISEIVQSASDMLAGGPAPPTVPTPIAPQTEPPSAEGGGFKLRRPKL